MAGVAKRKKLLVGVSGGRDSMVLLHALLAAGFKNLVVCHLNHTLRGRSSDADARLVVSEARRLNLPVEHARSRTAEFATAKKNPSNSPPANCAWPSLRNASPGKKQNPSSWPTMPMIRSRPVFSTSSEEQVPLDSVA
jgi:hypothetical protein